MEQTNMTVRYILLSEQFYLENSHPSYITLKESLDRIFHYIYNHTNITYLDFVDGNVLYNYIKYHRNNNFSIISFIQTIKDIKTYLFFLRNVKNKDNIPSIDLSLQNYHFWARL